MSTRSKKERRPKSSWLSQSILARLVKVTPKIRGKNVSKPEVKPIEKPPTQSAYVSVVKAPPKNFEIAEDEQASVDESKSALTESTAKSEAGSRLNDEETLSEEIEADVTELSRSTMTASKAKELPKDLPKIVDKNMMKIVAEQNLREIGRNGFEHYRKQWMQICEYKSPGTSVNFTKNGMSKNRYSDVMCLDHSRVVLQSDEDSACDYIHASHVHGIFKERQYILTQGPKNSTVVDFWRMVWQQKAGLILNLVQPEEHRTHKCAWYWPQMEGTAGKYGTFTVENKKVNKQVLADNQEIVISQLRLSRGKDSLNVMHCQWNNWPDKSAPVVGSGAIYLVNIINKYHQRTFRPAIAHCSAGIGRSGTLIGLAIAVQYIDAGRLVDFPTLVRGLRMQRQHAVQRDVQYLFLVRCFIDYCHHHKLVPMIPEVCTYNVDYERFIFNKTGAGQTPTKAGDMKTSTYKAVDQQEKLIQK